MYDYLIVGAGLTGSTFAHEMTKAGAKCIVIDERRHIAGNCYTEENCGILVHKYGTHVLKTDNKGVLDYISEFCNPIPFTNSPIAICGDKAYSMPFGLRMMSEVYGKITPRELMNEIERDKVPCSEPKNLEEYALSKVGKRLYEMFIKGYTEKQWGKTCRELPVETMSDIPIRESYDVNYFDFKYQVIPENGYTEMVKNMLEGVEVRLNTPYSSDMKYGRLLYTGKIDRYFRYENGRLEYRRILFDERMLKERNHQGNAVVNFCDASVPYTRCTEHKHFSRKIEGDSTIITYEYPSKDIGIECYPMLDEANRKRYSVYEEKAKEERNVIFGGRLGTYEYDDMAVAIEKAREIARRENG